MRVGLNVLHLVPGETGGSEIYARRLIPELRAARADLQLVAFAGREATPSLQAELRAADVEVVRLGVSSRSRIRRVMAEQALLPPAAARARVDLVHNLFTTAPVFPGVPQVTTILDVIYKRHPETHAGLLRYGMAVLVPLAARRSRRVIAISEAAKADIVELLGIPPQRVDVTLLGPGLSDDLQSVPADRLRERLALGDRPIVLTVSAKRPHKNLGRLLEAFGRVPETSDGVLVVPGYATPFETELERQTPPGARDRVRFVGWLEDAELDGLYRAATCLVFPSLAEGFGLPVLEAMRRGLPVACSDTSSLPEIAGEAALYFDPTDTDAIAKAIGELLRNEELREQLRRRGLEQARRFSWERTGLATLASYERALERTARGPACS